MYHLKDPNYLWNMDSLVILVWFWRDTRNLYLVVDKCDKLEDLVDDAQDAQKVVSNKWTEPRINLYYAVLCWPTTVKPDYLWLKLGNWTLSKMTLYLSVSSDMPFMFIGLRIKQSNISIADMTMFCLWWYGNLNILIKFEHTTCECINTSQAKNWV